ncbi:MAG: hypothetical protein ACOH2H_16140 [Cypionkella sp.]
MIRIHALPLVLFLSGCLSPEQMQSVPYQTATPIAANYQAVYARTLQAMRICLHDGRNYFPSPAQNHVDGQLYPDLGYGEITSTLAGVIVTTNVEVRIERAGKGALVKTRAPGDDAANRKGITGWTIYWAKGGTACPSMAQGGLIPPLAG